MSAPQLIEGLSALVILRVGPVTFALALVFGALEILELALSKLAHDKIPKKEQIPQESGGTK